MTDPASYGLCELARELSLPESTIRYYRDAFVSHIPSTGRGRRRRYPVEALDTLRFIAREFAAGCTRDEIAAALSDGGERAPAAGGTTVSGDAVLSDPTDHVVTALIRGEREQRELMWHMIREMSRFGDAIERQHYVLAELVQRIFARADLQLPAGAEAADSPDTVDAEIVHEADVVETSLPDAERTAHKEDIEALRQALAQERDLVERLRQSKLTLERRAAAAEAELEQLHEREPGLLRRLFERDRGR